MAKRSHCHICGQLLIVEGAEDCPVNHRIPDKDKIIAKHDITLSNGKTIPKGTEASVESMGEKNVRFYWINEETGNVERNTVSLKHFEKVIV